MMEVASYGLSDIGLNRDNNEDAWAEIPDLHFYALADGMGGHQAGEIASNETIESLVKTMTHVLTTKFPLSIDELELELKEAILEANSWVYHLSDQHEEMRGMGTTLCCLLLHQSKALFAHVGDSRIYRFRQKLELLTRDHSLRREMAQRYHLSEKTPGLPSKNVITRAIGTSNHVEPDIRSILVEEGDIYLLCSDGLTDCVDGEEIAHILQGAQNPRAASETLLQAALAKGGQDNITVITLKIESN